MDLLVSKAYRTKKQNLLKKLVKAVSEMNSGSLHDVFAMDRDLEQEFLTLFEASESNHIQKMCGCKVFQVVCPLRVWRTALSVGHVITSAMARLLFITFIRRSI